MRRLALGCVVIGASAAAPATAQQIGDSVPIGETATLDPILAARLRYEGVHQNGADEEAEAVTLRLRAGAELTYGSFSVLAEGEGTLALVDDYNDTLPGNGIEPFPIVADPENFEINRLQASFRRDQFGATLGRQRIILDDARFVGNVGWRQNEQTFDALRVQGKAGPFSVDASYAVSQRTIFGTDSPNTHFDGDFVLLGAGFESGPVKAKSFAYLIDYDLRSNFSSNTFGLLVDAEIPLPGVPLRVRARLATQADAGANPDEYQAEYYQFELRSSLASFDMAAGYEELGSDGGAAAFQTPLATGHAFNGWSDLFLTTPALGLRDHYFSIGRKFGGIGPFSGLQASLTYHEFDSDFGSFDYGTEWDASLGFEAGRVAILAKYARFDSAGFAADIRKFWLQAEGAF